MNLQKTLRQLTPLLICGFTLSGLVACGPDAEENQQSVSDDAGNNQQDASDNQENQETLEECLDDCGDGCPAEEYSICASDGELYCNECVIECHDLDIADDESLCESEVETPCPDDLEQVDSEGDCLQDDAICLEVEAGVWCTGPDDPADPVNTAPEISTISDQIVEPSGSTGPLDIFVSDAETPADELILSAESLDPAIIAQGQITLGGSGENRTIEVEAGPAVGTATIELTLSDGELATSTQFDITFTDFCPLMSYDCATGCCSQDSHVISEQRGSYAYLDVGPEGNVYITYALPSSTAWSSGLTVYTAATGEWNFFSYGSGNTRPGISVGPSGRIHHTYARNTGSVYYQYSDDQGQSWTPIDGISGSLAIGGVCAMNSDSNDDPHLICRMDESLANSGNPRYFETEGGAWNSHLPNVSAPIHRSTQMHIGYADRAHMVHTYGPTEAPLHYSRESADQWLTEVVPIPDGFRGISRDRRVGFVLADEDVVHVAFGLRTDDANDYSVWYGVRTTDPDTGLGEWNFEEVIANGELVENTAPDIFLDLDENGEPVMLTNLGTGAYRSADGDWNILQTGNDQGIYEMAVHEGKIYIVFPVDGASYAAQRLHMSVLDLTP